MEDRMLSDEILLALIKKAGESGGDLKIFGGTTTEWAALTDEEKKQYDFYVFTDDYISNPVGNLADLDTEAKTSCVAAINELVASMAVKKLDYTGTGTTSIAHDFGSVTPKMILQIVTDPAVEQNGDWHCIHSFPWGSKMSEVRWSVGNNNAPNVGGNGGNYTVGISYAGNVMTITGRDAGGACNMSNRSYSVYYI